MLVSKPLIFLVMEQLLNSNSDIFFSNLHSWEMEHDIKLSWNFFATSHGKGVVDGIGGTVKRTVWRHIKTEKHHITSAQEYATLAKELCQTFLCSKFQRMKWKRIMHSLTFDGKGFIHYQEPNNCISSNHMAATSYKSLT